MCSLCEFTLYRPRPKCRTAVEYWLRFAIAEPAEFAYVAPRRAACRLLSWHNVTCRGRPDPHPRRW